MFSWSRDVSVCECVCVHVSLSLSRFFSSKRFVFLIPRAKMAMMNDWYMFACLLFVFIKMSKSKERERRREKERKRETSVIVGENFERSAKKLRTEGIVYAYVCC